MARVPLGSAFIAVAALVFALPGQGHLATAADGRVHLIAAYDSSEEANLGNDVVADARSILRNLSRQHPLGSIGDSDDQRQEARSCIDLLRNQPPPGGATRGFRRVLLHRTRGVRQRARPLLRSAPQPRRSPAQGRRGGDCGQETPHRGADHRLLARPEPSTAARSPSEPLKALKGPSDVSPLFHHLFFARYGLIQHHVVQARGGFHHPG